VTLRLFMLWPGAILSEYAPDQPEFLDDATLSVLLITPSRNRIATIEEALLLAAPSEEILVPKYFRMFGCDELVRAFSVMEPRVRLCPNHDASLMPWNETMGEAEAIKADDVTAEAKPPMLVGMSLSMVDGIMLLNDNGL